LIVEEDLAKGHQIVGLVRDPSKLQATEVLDVIVGTPISASDLGAAAAGCDAILVALNNPRTSDAPWAKPLTTEKILTKTARNIITEVNDKHVVFMSALGVGDSFEGTPWFMRCMIERTNLKYAYTDHNSVELALRNSDLDWTLVRAAGLSNCSKAKPLIVGTATEPKPGMMIRRRAVADFMLDCAENGSYVGEAPVISE